MKNSDIQKQIKVHKKLYELFGELSILTDDIADLLWTSGVNGGMLKYINKVNSMSYRFSDAERLKLKQLALKKFIQKSIFTKK